MLLWCMVLLVDLLFSSLFLYWCEFSVLSCGRSEFTSSVLFFSLFQLVLCFGSYFFSISLPSQKLYFLAVRGLRILKAAVGVVCLSVLANMGVITKRIYSVTCLGYQMFDCFLWHVHDHVRKDEESKKKRQKKDGRIAQYNKIICD